MEAAAACSTLAAARQPDTRGLDNFTLLEPVGTRPGREADARADLATLIRFLGEDQFERALYSWTLDIAKVSVLFAIELYDSGSGRVLVTEGRDVDLTQRARLISRDYAETDYAEDEVFAEHNHGLPGEIDLVVQAGADRHGSFRYKYFDDMGTLQEISVFGRETGSTLYVGFSSAESGFNEIEIARLKTVSPLIINLVRKHAAIVDARGLGIHALRERRLDTLHRVLLQHESALTCREAEVCAAIVIGYRAEAVADRLGISPNTVATHRKRAYAKLNISSQTELFGIFFGGWSS